MLFLGSIKKDRWQAMRVFGAAWFIAAYLPISNIIQLNATAAEHWLYLPSVGLLVFGAGFLFQLPIRFRRLVTTRSEEHTSELQSHSDLVCRLLLEKKKENIKV